MYSRYNFSCMESSFLAFDFYNVIIPESDSTHEFANKVDELIALPGHVLGATSIQVLEDDLNDLKWTQEEDGVVETLDPQFLLGSELLEIIDATSFDLLLEPILIISLSFSEVLLLGAVFLTTIVEIGLLGGTTIVEVILVKGHIFPSIVKVLAVGFQLYPILV
ncbi:hypothetical protein Tco_1416910 [Tanacetum coccineum]